MTTQPKTYLEQAIEDGHARITGDGKTQRIHYDAASHSERWSDPEEKIRAEFWAELIYKYQYRPERMRFEVKVPRRTPHDLADIVVYGDTLRPDYLAAILRSSLTLAQTRHMMTGNAHPRLTNEDVVSLVIPMPKPVIQEAIAIEARRRRDESRRLCAEADAGWQAAKRWFEDQLLGPVQP